MHSENKASIRESFVEDSSRVDQIVRVDASALLKTIRELEYKLTEHQKSDKPPAWAVALEQRMEQLENNYFQSQSKIDGPDLPPVKEEEIESTNTTGSQEGPSSPTKVENIREDGHKEEEHHKRSVSELATEMRVVGKVRKEIENKFHTAEVHLDSKLSGFNLQIDRLMKLLQIRPTTSELQTVMNAVYDVDKKVAITLDDIRTDIRSTLKEKVSEEISSIIDEIKDSKNLSENSIKCIQTTVDSFATEMSDIRDVTENTVLLINTAMEGLKGNNAELEDHISKLKFQIDKTIQEQSGALAELKAEHFILIDDFQNYKNKTEEDSIRIFLQVEENKKELINEISRLDTELNESNKNIILLTEKLDKLQNKYDLDLSNQNNINKQTTDILNDYAKKIQVLNKDVEVLISYDIPGHIKSVEEEIKKSNINIAVCSESIETAINGDLKVINTKVAVLQEQCNIQIPNAYGEMSLRIDTIHEQLVVSNTAIEKTQVRLQATDDTVGELMPLLDRMTTVETHSNDQLAELSGLKESLTNTIDTTDELIRRVEEVEETVEGLEGSVTNRMDQVSERGRERATHYCYCYCLYLYYTYIVYILYIHLYTLVTCINYTYVQTYTYMYTL